jgi:TonB-dependent SusC/RagA subfamily outer membrane receptor
MPVCLCLDHFKISIMMKPIVAIVTGVLLTASAISQTRVVHGRLTTFNTYPVQNVAVTSKKGKATTVSDSLGRFSIVCLEHDAIMIKPRAFRKVTKKVGPDTDSLNVNLIFLDTPKNRDIAIGYGYMKESDLLYAVTNLQQENNEYCHYSDVYEVLRGRFAGVEVVNGQVIIRGSNSINSSNEALYVVDGMIVSSIDWVVPCDIKSINILKDSSTSAYGSRGSNGVVIIETRRGGTD